MTCYKDAGTINELLKSYPDSFDIYIHIDQKSPIPLNEIRRDKGILFKIKKYDINWGGVQPCVGIF